MKKVITLFFLLISVSTLAQVTNNTVNNRPIRIALPYSEISPAIDFSKAFIVIDGIFYRGNINDLDGGNVSNTNYLDSANAVKIYGKKAAKGAILITTKKAYFNIKNLACLSQPKKLLYIVDGKIFKRGIKKLSTESILDIYVLAGSQAKALYGSKGANGVVLITTKVISTTAAMIHMNCTVSKLDTSEEPLYVVNGVICKLSLNAIDPKDILKIDILKKAEAEAAYGFKGVNGVVLITTRKAKLIDTINKHR